MDRPKFKFNIMAIKKPVIVKARRMNEAFEVMTQTGMMYGKAGDYLIIDILGEMCPIAKQAFEMTYSVVEEKEEEEYEREEV
jgi:hypothetical protein